MAARVSICFIHANGVALNYGGKIFTDGRAEVGLRFDRGLGMFGLGGVTLKGRLAYAHDWASDPMLAAVFAFMPGAGFTVEGAKFGRNAALVSLGPELRLGSATLSAKFDGDFFDQGQTLFCRAGMRHSW